MTMWKTSVLTYYGFSHTTQFYNQNVLELFVKQNSTQSMFKLPYRADFT